MVRRTIIMILIPLTSSSSIVVLLSVDSFTWDPSPFLVMILRAGVRKCIQSITNVKGQILRILITKYNIVMINHYGYWIKIILIKCKKLNKIKKILKLSFLFWLIINEKLLTIIWMKLISKGFFYLIQPEKKLLNKLRLNVL